MNVIELFTTPDPHLDFNKWQPDEVDKPRIDKCVLDYYNGTLKCCGLSPETVEAWELYIRISENSIYDCKDDIQGFFADLYDAVGGDIEKYYSSDPELISLIKLTVSPVM
jgi:hypothetical protein